MATEADSNRHALNWVDLVWLAFLTGLAMLPPLFGVHKQITLLGLGVFGRRDLAGRGEAAFYDGDLGPCQMGVTGPPLCRERPFDTIQEPGMGVQSLVLLLDAVALELVPLSVDVGAS